MVTKRLTLVGVCLLLAGVVLWRVWNRPALHGTRIDVQEASFNLIGESKHQTSGTLNAAGVDAVFACLDDCKFARDSKAVTWLDINIRYRDGSDDLVGIYMGNRVTIGRRCYCANTQLLVQQLLDCRAITEKPWGFTP